MTEKRILKRTIVRTKHFVSPQWNDNFIPELLRTQKESFKRFLERDSNYDYSLENVFKNAFPIEDWHGKIKIEYLDYILEKPQFSPEECKNRGISYASKLLLKLRLTTKVNKDSLINSKKNLSKKFNQNDISSNIIKNKDEQLVTQVEVGDFFIGYLPIQHETCTFIINGNERYVVSQLKRCAGPLLCKESNSIDKSSFSYLVKMIPNKGSWLEVFLDTKKIIYIKIDRKKKILFTTFLMCFMNDKNKTFSEDDTYYHKSKILQIFYKIQEITYCHKTQLIKIPVCYDLLEGKIFNNDILNENGEVLFSANSMLDINSLKKDTFVYSSINSLSSFISLEDVFNNDSGEIYFESGDNFSDFYINFLKEQKKDMTFKVVCINNQIENSYVLNTIRAEKNNTRSDALNNWGKIVKHSEYITIEGLCNFFKNSYMNNNLYDMSNIGRRRCIQKFQPAFLSDEEKIKYQNSNITYLLPEDIISMVENLILMYKKEIIEDDMDSYINRRVRAVGELMASCISSGLIKVSKKIGSKSLLSDASILNKDFLNLKTILYNLQEFFNTSPLSQYADQENALSCISHANRITVLGPGGISSSHAVQDSMRDTNPSQFSFICPTETPEGHRIGLVANQALLAKTDNDGFLVAPFLLVKNKKISKEIIWLNAYELSKHILVPKSSFSLNSNKELELFENHYLCRYNNSYRLFTAEQVTITEVTPLQNFSIVTSHLPNFEYCDGYRAAMAASMTKQALPLSEPQPPLIGTGIEKHSVVYSEEVVVAKEDGIVRMVDSHTICIESLNENKIPCLNLYELKKFYRSNQNTCINQKPIVRIGDIIKKGDILTDGSSTYKGELALGVNLNVMYLCSPYNYEDAMIINSDVCNEKIKNIAIYELTVEAKDTRYGTEEITRDLSNTDGELLANLDENGIITVGTSVVAGDYLVGKATPDGGNNSDPKIKLLRAIFDNKAETYKKTPLVVPPYVSGVVTNVKIFTKAGVEVNSTALANLEMEINRHENTFNHLKKFLISFLQEKIYELIKNEKIINNVGNIKKQITISKEHLKFLQELSLNQMKSILTEKEMINDQIKSLFQGVEKQINILEEKYQQKIKDLSTEYKFPDDTTLMVIKVTISSEIEVLVGDKFASRYGNKGVISKKEHRSNMPYLEDGTIVDLVLNPLGIIARMNLGQLYECLANNYTQHLCNCVNKYMSQYYKNPSKENSNSLRSCLIDAIGSEDVSDFYITVNEKKISIYDLSEIEILNLAYKLSTNIYALVPTFESIGLEELEKLLRKVGLKEDGKVKAYDGKTSEPLEGYVFVGKQFLMRLVHIVGDKIHARSVGPRLQRTGQPTKSKQNNGGQKCGEMENWALAAHGASFNLQEISIKSDDIKTEKVCFVQQCSGNPFSLLQKNMNDMLHKFKKLPLNKKIGDPQNLPVSFSLIKEELFACGFKITEEKVLHHKKLIVPNDNDEDIFKGEIPFIRLNNLDEDEHMQQYYEEKINEYYDDNVPSYEIIYSVALASKEDILAGSNGKVLNPETINYRTLKPEKNGLFCEAIFGPVNDFECSCGKYSGRKYFLIKCENEKCGVTILPSSYRRTLRGHIELNYPVIHPFYLRSSNNKICLLLGISYNELLLIKSFERFIIIDVGSSNYEYKKILSIEESKEIKEKHPDVVIESGAAAIKMLLEKINFEKEKIFLKEKIKEASSDLKKQHYQQILYTITKMELNGIRPEWMIMEVIPVLPADLRDIHEIKPSEFASSDLNILYREVIERNSRLRCFKDYDVTEAIIYNERRMLQEAVVSLLGGKITTVNKYKSISEFLQGKEGRFRKNALGKRVDYSGRSVIVVAPWLRMDECYIPRMMLIVLFQPYLYFLLKYYNITNSFKDAQKILNKCNQHDKIWDLLLEAIPYLPYCLLNRAPSLHRLSFLGFKIKVWCHKAIGLPALICQQFNADFDGDQMGVHIPLTIEGQNEASILMPATANILSSTNGNLVIGPRQDITIGLYTLTMFIPTEKKNKKILTFHSIEEVHKALLFKIVNSREEIYFYWNNVIYDTTVGRVILWEVIPKKSSITFNMINLPITGKIANDLLKIVHNELGNEATVNLAEDFKKLGFIYAEKFGISISLSDFPRFKNLEKLKEETKQKQIDFEIQYLDGLITYDDKNKKIHQIWTQVIRQCHEELEKFIKENLNFNPIAWSISSGARGSILQLTQIVGIKGFVAHVDGSTYNFVIKGNYLKGLNSFDAFDAQTAARTAGSNTSLKTAAAGYLTRKLVDVAHGIMISLKDCGTKEGITVKNTIFNGQLQSLLGEKILGRVLAEDIYNLSNQELLFKRNHFITEKDIKKIESIGIVSCKIRSPITCKGKDEVCSLCYGSDLSTGEIVSLGEAVGIIAAQSIGEPGSQLTLKSKTLGGVTQQDITSTTATSIFNGILKYHKIRTIDINGKKVVFSRGGKLIILNQFNCELIEYIIPYGAILFKENNSKVSIGNVLAEWDLHQPLLSEYNGVCVYRNIVDKVTCATFYDDSTGQTYKIIKNYNNTKNDLLPMLVIYNKDNLKEEITNYLLEENTIIEIENGEKVNIGDRLGKIQGDITTKIDIVGGLPKVSSLLENRQPKIAAILSPISGIIDIKKDMKGKSRIKITNNDKNEKNSTIEFYTNQKTIVQSGEYVDKGDQITIGTPSLNDVLDINGIDYFSTYFINNILQIYRDQGIIIKNIHFEIILRKLLSSCEILDSGDSQEYINGEIVEYKDIIDANKTLKNLIKFKRIFSGLTNTALNTPSLLSAMSFQGTTLVLADSITRFSRLTKLGFKEEFMLSTLVNVGTGFILNKIRNIILFSLEKKS